MKYIYQDWEISLKDLVFSVLYRWKQLVIVGMVFAILLGGLQGISFIKDRAASDVDITDESYAELMEAYEIQKTSLESRIENLESAISSHSIYLDESLLMQMDPHNCYTATATMYVETGYQIIPEMAYQTPNPTSTILALYEASLLDDAVVESIAEEYGIKATYLRELIVAEVKDNLLTVSVSHFEVATAEAILESLLDALNAQSSQISQVFDDHELCIMLKTSGSPTDTYIETTQKTATDRLASLKNELTSKTAELKALSAPGIPGSSATSLKDVVVWCVLGFFVGAVIIAVVYCCLFLFGNTVFSADELTSRLSLRVFGNLSLKKKPDLITSLLRNLEGRMVSDCSKGIPLTALNIRNTCPSVGNVLLCGGAKEADIQSVAELLKPQLSGMDLVACGSPLLDAEALRNMATCEAVILVEESTASTYKSIIKELNCISDAGKECIGFIVFE